MVLELLRQRQVVFITGKGGVGKTTLLAALAAAQARTGRPVVCAQMGAAASVSPVAAVFGAHPPRGVMLQTLDARLGQRLFLEKALRVKPLVQALLRSKRLRHFLEGGPGFLEMGMLFHLQHVLEQQEEGALCLVDLPASGHAVSMMQLPEFLLRFIPGGPIRHAAAKLRDLFTDSARSGCLLVAIPESLSTEETLELSRALERRRMPLLAVLLNRAPPEELPPEELEALAELSRTRDFWGAREVVHALRTREALRSLLGSLRVPLYVFPDLALQGQELCAALAEVAAAARPLDAALGGASVEASP